MKNLKLSFALIVGVLAAGITVATQAKSIMGARISGCFTTVTLTNGTASYTPASSDTKVAADLQIITNGKKFVSSASTATNPNCLLSSNFFCCVELQETSDTRATLINLGEGLKRYEVAVIRYKQNAN